MILPFTDSIFAVVGEELGLVRTLGVVLLFLTFAYRGLRIALRSHDSFGDLGCGITAWIAIQAFVNIAVNTATIPVGGLTLPFISYGGSSLLATMAAVGVLLSISRYGARALPANRPSKSVRQRSTEQFMRLLVSGGGTGGHVYPILAVLDALSQLSGPASTPVAPAIPAAAPAITSTQSAQTELMASVHGSPEPSEPLPVALVQPNGLPAARPQSSASRAAAESSDEIFYIGVAGAVEEELARRAGIPFQAIESGQVRGMAPWVAARNLLKAAKGSRQARSLMAEFRPDVVFVTGGFVAGPVVLAASRIGLPVFIYLPDVKPGLAIQRMSRFARKVGVTFPEVARYFPGKAVVTGYPV